MIHMVRILRLHFYEPQAWFSMLVGILCAKIHLRFLKKGYAPTPVTSLYEHVCVCVCTYVHACGCMHTYAWLNEWVNEWSSLYMKISVYKKAFLFFIMQQVTEIFHYFVSSISLHEPMKTWSTTEVRIHSLSEKTHDRLETDHIKYLTPSVKASKVTSGPVWLRRLGDRVGVKDRKDGRF